jgi:hypothetical protein
MLISFALLISNFPGCMGKVYVTETLTLTETASSCLELLCYTFYKLDAEELSKYARRRLSPFSLPIAEQLSPRTGCWWPVELIGSRIIDPSSLEVILASQFTAGMLPSNFPALV